MAQASQPCMAAVLELLQTRALILQLDPVPKLGPVMAERQRPRSSWIPKSNPTVASRVELMALNVEVVGIYGDVAADVVEEDLKAKTSARKYEGESRLRGGNGETRTIQLGALTKLCYAVGEWCAWFGFKSRNQNRGLLKPNQTTFMVSSWFWFWFEAGETKPWF
ncbi:hypothetical protein B0H13DRAFT_2512878 [Mycena leptocephala]|nr:hypothetical protein B0H13DRAFT_2512878 [Mycena leptocephala]